MKGFIHFKRLLKFTFNTLKKSGGGVISVQMQKKKIGFKKTQLLDSLVKLFNIKKIFDISFFNKNTVCFKKISVFHFEIDKNLRKLRGL